MSTILDLSWYERLRPNYSIRVYSDGFYKIVKFSDGGLMSLVLRDHSEDKKHDEKLYQAYCRARSAVLDLALCNNWEYFFTGTLDKSKWDRYRLDPFISNFTQWIRDQRKKGIPISYILIPEKHEDGAWHVHGLLSGIGRDQLCEFDPAIHPRYLVEHGFLNWPLFADRYGFVSLGPVRDSIAVSFYICKYVSKDFAKKGNSGRGCHLYYCSQGLNRSVKVGDVYGHHKYLDDLISEKYVHCSVGYTEAPWWRFLDYMEVEDNVPLSFGEGTADIRDSSAVVIPDSCPEWEKMQECLFAGVV